MYDVMSGVRVIEVAEHTFVPSAGVVLADWGASVIKIEAPDRDPIRYLDYAGLNPEELGYSFMYDIFRLRKGDYIECDTCLASTDPRAFDNPLQVDIARRPNPRLAFGGGPHRCFGSNLARAEIRIALEEWLGVIPEFSIKPGSQLRSHDGVHGLDALMLAW